MKQRNLICGVICLTVFSVSGFSQIRSKNYILSVNFEGEHCPDLKVKSDGQVAQASETFNLSRGEAPILEIQDTAGRSVIRVRGWERPDYSVEACRIAVAGDQATAEAAVRGISVIRTAGRFSTTGPTNDSPQWQLYFIVHAPRDGRFDLETKNGPIDVSGISGSLKVKASNGPVAFKDCGGQVDATTLNGPISFSGGGGEVRLLARNGPISLELTGEVWNGSQLNAQTSNGPVSLTLPDTFRSGVRVESAGGAPLSCGSPLCRNAWTNSASREPTLQMNGSGDTIRIVSNNGPVSVSTPKKGKRVI
jgi:hypothetical protein